MSVDALNHLKKKSITSYPNICNQQTKVLSKKKTPVCAELSFEDIIKILPDAFETSVRDNTKLANNFKSSSN